MVKLALDSIADFLAAAKSLLWFSSSSVCNSCISFSCFSINSVFSCWSSYSLFCCCSSNAWEMSRKQVTRRTENLSPGFKFLITFLSLQISHLSTGLPRNRFCLVTQRSSLPHMFECEQPFVGEERRVTRQDQLRGRLPINIPVLAVCKMFVTSELKTSPVRSVVHDK